MLQIKNLLQLTIELLICAPISQHYDNLGCYPPLIAHFHKKNLLQLFIDTLKMCCTEKWQTMTTFCLHCTMKHFFNPFLLNQYHTPFYLFALVFSCPLFTPCFFLLFFFPFDFWFPCITTKCISICRVISLDFEWIHLS